MNKLNLYLLKEFLSFFFGSLFLFVILVTIAEISARLSHYTQHIELMQYFISYHFFRIPHNIYYIFPVALMFSSTYVLGTFVKNKEMIAVENSGISLFKFSSPIFIIVIFLCLFLVFFWQFVAAPFNKKAFIANDTINGFGQATESGPWQLFGGNNYIYFIDTYFYEEQYMTNTIVLKLDDDGAIKMRISSPYIQWNNNDRKWYVSSGILTTFSDNKEITVQEITNYQLDVLERPEHFYGRPLLDSMSITEEARIIKLQKEVNMNTSKLETDLHYRISYCFSHYFLNFLLKVY